MVHQEDSLPANIERLPAVNSKSSYCRRTSDGSQPCQFKKNRFPGHPHKTSLLDTPQGFRNHQATVICRSSPRQIIKPRPFTINNTRKHFQGSDRKFERKISNFALISLIRIKQIWFSYREIIIEHSFHYKCSYRIFQLKIFPFNVFGQAVTSSLIFARFDSNSVTSLVILLPF